MGILYDLLRKRVSLSKRRLKEIASIARVFEGSKYFDWQLLDTFHGLGNFAGSVIPGIKPRLVSLSNARAMLERKGLDSMELARFPYHAQKILRDVGSILELLSNHKPISMALISRDLPRASVELFSDASAPDARFPNKKEWNGLGGCCYGRRGVDLAFAWQWPLDPFFQLGVEEGFPELV